MSPLCDYIPSAECLTRVDIFSDLKNAHMYSLIYEEKYDARAKQNFLTTEILKGNIYHITGGIAEISTIIETLRTPKQLTNLICAEGRWILDINSRFF